MHKVALLAKLAENLDSVRRTELGGIVECIQISPLKVDLSIIAIFLLDAFVFLFYIAFMATVN
jgi:hypothetical protein